jgi:hypothetical protein
VPSPETNEATRQEWRELDFFYDVQEDLEEWTLRGSKTGLANFVHIIRDYAAQSSNEQLGEHIHLGPYMYLEIGTAESPEITGHWIAGPLPSLNALATLIEQDLMRSPVGASMRFRAAFAPDSPYELAITIEDAGFDPATADAACW